MRSGTFSSRGSALLLSALAACSGIQAAPKAPLADFEASLVQLQGAYSAGEVVNCLAQPLASQTAVVCRDQIAQALMIAVDLRYEEFEIGFFDTNRYAGFGATLAALGLSTAGAVVSGGTSQILSAAAAGVIGAREGFKREILVEQTSVALLTAMRTQRDQVGVRIRLGLQRNATEYPLGAALADVSAYYRAGTIVGALTGVNEAVGVEGERARVRLEQSIEKPGPPPAPTQLLPSMPPPAPVKPRAQVQPRLSPVEPPPAIYRPFLVDPSIRYSPAQLERAFAALCVEQGEVDNPAAAAKTTARIKAFQQAQNYRRGQSMPSATGRLTSSEIGILVDIPKCDTGRHQNAFESYYLWPNVAPGDINSKPLIEAMNLKITDPNKKLRTDGTARVEDVRSRIADLRNMPEIASKLVLTDTLLSNQLTKDFYNALLGIR
jgi:hypothetical protein